MLSSAGFVYLGVRLLDDQMENTSTSMKELIPKFKSRFIYQLKCQKGFGIFKNKKRNKKKVALS